MQNSAWIFLCFCIAGVLPGLFFDVFRLLRFFIPHKNAFVIIEDTLWGIGVFLISFFCLIRYAGGVARWFFLFGMALGTLLYFLLFSPLVLGMLKAVIGFLIRIVRALLRPFWRFFKWIRRKLKHFLSARKVFLRKRRNSLENTEQSVV